MFIENINHQNINTKFNLLDAQKKDSENFIDYIKIALGEISKNQNHAKIDSEKFILNQSGTSLNDVMINLEKSSISMQLAVQIRNKIVSAYQEIMSQQI
ncbi:flagellar hook-basal body complex protein FliE [Buchnera aphidicola]|uniref:flagellar hook-basal body complex protein FliE n=1 Tax=Buchnera aphidicola TaxID=9 RepID=UPI000189C561|nr:flagellar hook-basal body complex protein FliE [Buchnera aphidicola]ADP66468.1 flagellar hook-basal body complex protein FliE [Buchnera aphidicola str. TLW03 (Acyrthosiphon pisum)]ADP67622.1 flagellar hook-basal body complex protein FliE [Buchnera aphidicola str. JF98 (Acyrthosiphon pisum)]ACL29896.1 flagellar hook-basal body complex protein FliE [Buchnera aphidicola str. Tuc7 (Acyrthosiphon pisum)]ADP65896.1 flagellar hook-basal body complex protein FliE [Buchnera aphidicola str. LL01 (Acyr